jgi:hypothetical protein
MFTIALLAMMMAPTANPPKSKWPIGKETTFVTGPLDRDGYVDYAAALNERLGRGITPENNANVWIWKAVGPRPFGVPIAKEYFKALGVEPRPKTGVTIVR